MRILLLHPNCEPDVPWIKDSVSFAGLACVAGALRAAGYANVRFLDATLGRLSEDDLHKVILREQPDLVAVGAICPSLASPLRLLKTVKDVCPKALTILGGVQRPFDCERLLDDAPWIDVVALGESIEFFRAIVRAVETGTWPETRASLPGIAYADGDRVLLTPLATTRD